MVAPGFVRDIQVGATQSTINISWSVPITSTGNVMAVHHYSTYYVYGKNNTVGANEIAETQYEISNLEPCTFTFIMIAAVYQGIYGPNVCIGLSTGTGPFVLVLKYRFKC